MKKEVDYARSFIAPSFGHFSQEGVFFETKRHTTPVEHYIKLQQRGRKTVWDPLDRDRIGFDLRWLAREEFEPRESTEAPTYR